MRKYCKAYRLSDLRQFSGWSEQRQEQDEELSDESIVYVWDDWVVVRSPVQEQGVIFDAVTPQWRDFCVNELHFAIPEDLRYAYEQQGEQQQQQQEEEMQSS